jgi:hypothetical protein
MNFASPDSCYMPCPSHLPLLHHSYYAWRRVQVMNLLIMQPTVTLSLFDPNPCSQTPSVYVLPQCQRQVSHSYRTTGKIIILYILMFMFLDSRQEDKGSGLNIRKLYPNSISSSFPPESSFDLLLSFPNI